VSRKSTRAEKTIQGREALITAYQFAVSSGEDSGEKEVEHIISKHGRKKKGGKNWVRIAREEEGGKTVGSALF